MQQVQSSPETTLKPFYESYRFCPRCGHRYEPAEYNPEDLLFTCSSCRYLFYQNSVPSATVVVPSSENPYEILLIRRGTPPGIGKLALPGGFVGYGELPQDAIVREALEETLVQIQITGRLCESLVDYHFQGTRICVLELAFVAMPVEPAAAGKVTGEASATLFVDVRDMQLRGDETLAFPEQRNVLHSYVQHLAANAAPNVNTL